MGEALILNIGEMFQKQFGTKPYIVPELGNEFDQNDYRVSSRSTKAEKEYTPKGSLIREQYLGVEIFLPINIYDGHTLLMYLPYSVVRISGANDWVDTPLLERKGRTHELYTSDDYKISIKGFLIGADRKFPEAELQLLKEAKEKRTSLILDNALTNIFLTDPGLLADEQRRVIIRGIDLPEVSGGREHVRPFTMQLESDFIQTLELE